MKKKSIVVLVCCLSIVFLWNHTFASARDTLRGSEGLPVFSIIYTSDSNTIPCYIEYHDYMKEYFNKGVVAYYRTCIDYKFHNKNITHVYTSSIDSFRIGHDFYTRLLKSATSKGILAKKINTKVFNCYEFILDDYTDLRIKDSLKTLAFGLGAKNNQQSYLIIELANQYYIYSTNDEKIDLPISSNFIQLNSIEIIPFLKKHIGEKINQIKNIDTLYSVSEIKNSLIQVSNEKNN